MLNKLKSLMKTPSLRFCGKLSTMSVANLVGHSLIKMV